ncbi:MAG: hypothetical protein M3Z21_00130 [Pseudomonadota bacterium]|nr:hypothetical protein [Pseudomonadota bacterium]
MTFPEKEHFTPGELAERWSRMTGQPIAEGDVLNLALRRDLRLSLVLEDQMLEWFDPEFTKRYSVPYHQVPVSRAVLEILDEEARKAAARGKLTALDLAHSEELGGAESQVYRVPVPNLLPMYIQHLVVISRAERDRFEREHGISPEVSAANKDSPARKPHGNAIRYSSTRERVLGAALAVLANLG